MVARLGGDEFVVVADIRGIRGAGGSRGADRALRGASQCFGPAAVPPLGSASEGRSRNRAGRAAADFLRILDTDMYGRKRAKKLPTETASGRGFGLEEPLCLDAGGSTDPVPRLYIGPVGSNPDLLLRRQLLYPVEL